MIGYRFSVAVVVLAVATGSCQSDPTALMDPETQLASVVPAGGAVGVDPAAPVVAEFTHPVMDGMEKYMAVHEGEVTGPTIAGAWEWSEDRTRATFRPSSPLKSGTRYTIHLGGGMLDLAGHVLGLSTHGPQMGGQWATGQMMSGGMTGVTGSMMGPGWRHANGSYGMLFTFTTA